MIRSIKWLWVIALSLVLLSCQSVEKHYLAFDSAEALQAALRWSPDAEPLVSAHRGGPMKGFPENCLETFEHILSYAPCLIECDVRKSSDGVLVMMHDETLNRTTTGTGPVANYTLAELKALRLKDDRGKVTKFRIPTLAETLEWARDKAILAIDTKNDVTPEAIVSAIKTHNAEAYASVITYNLPAAQRYHQLNPRLMISASAVGYESVKRLLASDIDKTVLMGFVGVGEPDRELYDMLHRNGIRAILGTMGNLDRRAEKRGVNVYVDLLRNGADILATDNVPLAAQAIRKFIEGRKN